MGCYREIGITRYKLTSSTEEKKQKILFISHKISQKIKRPRIQKELNSIEKFEANLKLQIQEFKKQRGSNKNLVINQPSR